jgi:transcriptional regulator with PAS, ATPase and Fis domain
MSDTLLESRLFGYKKGAFTGAEKDTPGIFKSADGGTVFLDEIADITPYMQQTLLRVLQEKEIRPLGGGAEKIDVRIIAATNKNLVDLCRAEKYRFDLYYRLAVTDLHLPDLQTYCKKDTEELILFFLKSKSAKFRKPSVLKLSDALMNFLPAYSFPGNIRELENIIENMCVFCDTEADTGDLPSYIFYNSTNNSLLLKDAEREHVRRVLKLFNGNQRQAAMALGITVNTLKAKMKEK